MKNFYKLGGLLSVLLIMGSAAAFTAPRSNAFEASTSNQLRRTTTAARQTASQSTEVTSANHHTACKRGCEERYSSCIAAKKAKGWSDDRAEKTCGLAARSCKGGCDRQ